MTAGAWYKVITDAGSEPLAYAFQSTDTNTEDFAWWIGSFDNVDTSNPLVETSGWQYQENEVAPIASAVTTLRNDNYVVASWFVINDTDVTMPGAPWTTLENNLTNNGRNLNVAGRLLSDPGSSGDVSITGVGSGNDTFTIQFALRSAGEDYENISNLNLFANQVITRHENEGPIKIAEMAQYDNSDDSDVPFTVSLGVTDSLTVLANNGLTVWGGDTFAPDGEVTLTAGGAGGVSDGAFTVLSGATYQAAAGESLSIGGSVLLESGSTFTPSTASVLLTATSTGRTIATPSNTWTVNDISFTGTGEWELSGNIVSQTGVSVDAGSLIGTGNVTVETGSLSGAGSIAFTGGTTAIESTNTFGDITPWQFNNLRFGETGVVGVTANNAATTTVLGTLTIASAHTFNAGSGVIELLVVGQYFRITISLTLIPAQCSLVEVIVVCRHCRTTIST